MYLNDSGGQYHNGTTDTTRTFAFGPQDPQRRLHYTAVLKGFCRLFHCSFPAALRAINWMPLAVGRCGIWVWILIMEQDTA